MSERVQHSWPAENAAQLSAYRIRKVYHPLVARLLVYALFLFYIVIFMDISYPHVAPGCHDDEMCSTSIDFSIVDFKFGIIFIDDRVFFFFFENVVELSAGRLDSAVLLLHAFSSLVIFLELSVDGLLSLRCLMTHGRTHSVFAFQPQPPPEADWCHFLQPFSMELLAIGNEIRDPFLIIAGHILRFLLNFT
jgi:hypothetical protein